MRKQALNFLLVEDDPDHAHLVVRSLKRHCEAHEVSHVADGEEALRYLRKEHPFQNQKRPDVILLDLKLPKVDGHQVLKAIKEDEKLARIPVVVLTTSDAEIDRVEAYKNHANSYIVKPIDYDKFQKMASDLSLYWGEWNTPADHE